ncbi:MAG: Uma2 family endonuclease [Chloroflexota bacterium]
MAVAKTKTLMTAEEFFSLPETEGKQELVRGEVVEMSPVGGMHGRTAVRLSRRMDERAEQTGAGVVVVETGYVLERGPDTVRGPDVSFISATRLPGGSIPDTFIDMAPDIAVEIFSPGDRLTELRRKAREYLAAGAQRVWMLHPTRKTATVYSPDGSERVLRGDDILSGEDLLPGFEVHVGDLFD